MQMNNYEAFMKGECSEIEYLKFTQIGENKPGSIEKFNIFKTYEEDVAASIKKAGRAITRKKKDKRVHYFYVIKRANQVDYEGKSYSEFKIVDLNPAKGTVTCLYKDKVYENCTCKQFWDDNHRETDVQNKVDYYLDTVAAEA